MFILNQNRKEGKVSKYSRNIIMFLIADNTDLIINHSKPFEVYLIIIEFY